MTVHLECIDYDKIQIIPSIVWRGDYLESYFDPFVYANWEERIRFIESIKYRKDYITLPTPADLVYGTFEWAWDTCCEKTKSLLWPRDVICTPIDSHMIVAASSLIRGCIYILDTDLDSDWWVTFDTVCGHAKDVLFYCEGL